MNKREVNDGCFCFLCFCLIFLSDFLNSPVVGISTAGIITIAKHLYQKCNNDDKNTTFQNLTMVIYIALSTNHQQNTNM